MEPRERLSKEAEDIRRRYNELRGRDEASRGERHRLKERYQQIDAELFRLAADESKQQSPKGMSAGKPQESPGSSGAVQLADETLPSPPEEPRTLVKPAAEKSPDLMATLRKSAESPISPSSDNIAEVMATFTEAEDSSRQRRWADAVKAYERAFAVHEGVAEAWCQ